MSFVPGEGFSSIEEVIRDAAEGRAFILMDSEERENEGDIVVVADKVSAATISMMIRHGSGIVCLAFPEECAQRLGLSLLVRNNADDSCPSFTTSIDARYGITTGVSAEDRAITILTAVKEESSAKDFVTPGHVFPIVAAKGGLAKRRGHTEASVAIARLAGSSSAGAVICEMMNEDGTMARLPEIMAFSREHDLKVTTINRLLEYLGLS